jgi:hypothetical protein
MLDLGHDCLGVSRLMIVLHGFSTGSDI